MIKWLGVIGVAGALTLTGCSSTSHETDSGAPASGVSAGVGEWARVSIETRSEGQILTGPNGHALYTYDSDTSTASSCDGACAANWPPLVGTPRAGDGVDAYSLSTIKRPDGSMQVTYEGRPLYYYVKDTEEDDVYGDGVAGAWHVAMADETYHGESPSSGTG